MSKLILGILLLSTSLLADIKKDISLCTEKKGELTRLDCFDSVAIKYKLAKETKKQIIKGTGKWNVINQTNPLNDTNSVILTLVADSGLSKWNKSISLIARCKNNKTELYINWGSYLGRKARITTRIGKNKATTKNWDISTDSKASFYRGKTITLLRTMAKNEKAIFQVTPYNESPITAIFDIKGLNNALIPLAKECNWKIN